MPGPCADGAMNTVDSAVIWTTKEGRVVEIPPSGTQCTKGRTLAS